MKIIKYLLIIVAAFILIERPHFALTKPQEAKAPLPQHVKSRLGTSAHAKLQGIDISHYDGRVDFELVGQSNVHFVYMKATQGTTYIDPTYQGRVSALKGSELLHGAYHFYEPDKDAIAQATHFLEQVKISKHTLPPMLDVEITQQTSPEDIKKGVKLWLEHVYKALKCQPILYSYGSFWEENLGDEFNDYPFWLADYATKPNVPAQLKNWRIWQYTDQGQISGIEHKVDRNILIEKELTCHV